MTHIDRIAEALSKVRIKESVALEIAMTMRGFAEERSTTFGNCIRVPAFRKLWQALEEMCDQSIDPEEPNAA